MFFAAILAKQSRNVHITTVVGVSNEDLAFHVLKDTMDMEKVKVVVRVENTDTTKEEEESMGTLDIGREIIKGSIDYDSMYDDDGNQRRDGQAKIYIWNKQIIAQLQLKTAMWHLCHV